MRASWEPATVTGLSRLGESRAVVLTGGGRARVVEQELRANQSGRTVSLVAGALASARYERQREWLGNVHDRLAVDGTDAGCRAPTGFAGAFCGGEAPLGRVRRRRRPLHLGALRRWR